MMRLSSQHARLLPIGPLFAACLLASWLGVATKSALAQTPSDAISADLIRALDELVETLPPETQQSPLALRELSRLLPQPDWQITWLRMRVDQLCRANLIEAANELLTQTRAMASQWEARQSPASPAVARALADTQCAARSSTPPDPTPPEPEPQSPVTETQPAAPTPSPQVADALSAITDPKAFAAALNTRRGELRTLPPTEKTLLVGKGVSPRELGLSDADAPAATATWRTLDGLATATTELASLSAALRDEHLLRKAATSGDSTAGAARALLAIDLRALGFDARDGAAGNPLVDSGPHRQAAAQYAQQGLWLWAALAELAAVSAGAADAAPRAQQQLAALTEIMTDAPRQRMLRRLQDWAGGTVSGGVSLTGATRESRRAARAAAEQSFKTLWNNQPANREGVGALLDAMQRAKAESVGLAASAFSIDALLNELPREQSVPRFVFALETLEVDGRLYGAFIGAKNCSFIRGDEYVYHKIGPVGGATELLTALTPLVCGGQSSPTNDRKIFIGLDGALLQPAGLTALERAFLPASPNKETWLVYAPALAALLPDSKWTAEPAYRFALISRARELDFGCTDCRPLLTPAAAAPRTLPKPGSPQPYGFIALGLGGAAPAPSGSIDVVMRDKAAGREPALTTIWLLVARR